MHGQVMILHSKFQCISIYFAGDIRSLVDPYFAVHIFFQNTKNKNSIRIEIFDCNDQVGRIF